MHDNINIKGLRIDLGDSEYVCDFNAFFELANPRDDIYTPDGAPAPDRGQDEVNFLMVQLTESVQLTPKFSPVIESAMLAELEAACLDWCRDNGDAHMEAFKQAKGHK